MTLEGLTATEARIASLLARGWADADVRAALALRPHEVERQLGEVYRKLGVHSRTEIALLFGPELVEGIQPPPAETEPS
jgi:DNA-binding NarL/FixJ family response regulator